MGYLVEPACYSVTKLPSASVMIVLNKVHCVSRILSDGFSLPTQAGTTLRTYFMQGGVLETNLAVMLPPPLINRERLRTLISGIRPLDRTWTRLSELGYTGNWPSLW